MSDIESFDVAIPEDELAELQQRLRATRWPDAETPDDWSQGVPLAYAQEFCRYWAEEYDWASRQARLNSFNHYKTTLDGLPIHFIHAVSPEANARPIVITHGWPGTIVEFLKVIEPLSNPVAHGGRAEDAFHVVCPSLPGYGFSRKPASTGYGVPKIAGMWDQLMVKLGYGTYFA